VELIELREDRARFLLRGAKPAFANAIRRACLAEVPSLAIDEISIYDNTSVLFDEQLSLRLGLVPIKADDLSLYSVPEECDCGGAGCPACQVQMTLTAEGPCTVHSGDLRFADPGVKVAFEKIPIAILGEGEKLMIEGIVTLNRGTVHTKWQAGTQCGYKNLPEIRVSDVMAAEGASRSVPGRSSWSERAKGRWRSPTPQAALSASSASKSVTSAPSRSFRSRTFS